MEANLEGSDDHGPVPHIVKAREVADLADIDVARLGHLVSTRLAEGALDLDGYRKVEGEERGRGAVTIGRRDALLP